MPKEAEITQLEENDAALSSLSSSAEEQELRESMLALSRRITALAEARRERVRDIANAQEMAMSIKPYVDRLYALQRLLNPVDRIVEKSEQIQELQADLADDVAEVEHLSGDMAGTVEEKLLNDLEGEIASVKRDRKLFVSEIAEEEVESTPSPRRRGGSQHLLDLPVPARLERIFGKRFISLERLSSLLNLTFTADFVEEHNRLLENVWRTIFDRSDLLPHVEKNRIKTLQRTFADYALLLRSAELPPAAESSSPLPCTLENMRRQFDSFFLSTADRGLWYTQLDFYRQPLGKSHWALVDRQYLNCTFKKPGIRLLMYARANGLAGKMVRQKSLLEDIYDRILLELNLRERFFDNCNSITSTTYQQGKNAPLKQVYVYCKEDCIRISGKRGTPHWRPTKPRWPGVLPAIIFSS